jgi:hypothetical protein
MALVLALGSMIAPALSNDELSAETAVKATYLYKFVPFITWPDAAFTSPTSPFVICILGDDAVADSLGHVLAGQRNGAHGIVVRKLTSADTGCHILYVPGSDEKLARSATDLARGKPILTVTDMPAHSASRGVIDFIIVGDHVRFSIDQAEATRSGLSVSSKLLSLAVAVEM